ncbi:MAG: Maf family protein [Patescibacteria group bacterium]
MKDSKIILATTSKSRIQAFKFLNINFESQPSNVDESVLERKNPKELVKELSRLKAEAVIKNNPNSIVIGFDSIGFFNGQILEKPKSKKEIFNRLKSISGNKHEFYTGIYAINTSSSKTISKVVKTEMIMRNISEYEINKYIEQDGNYNTYALGYDPLGNYSSTFIKEIKGSYNNITRGIPLEIIPELLLEIEKK